LKFGHCVCATEKATVEDKKEIYEEKQLHMQEERKNMYSKKKSQPHRSA